MTVSIFYGTFTGGAQAIAEKIQIGFNQKGIATQLFDMSSVSASRIKETNKVILVTSTWGDGEPPMDAQSFYDDLKDDNADFSSVSYAVFGLGESYYEQFCQAAIDMDNFMVQKGAKRLLDVEKADGDAEPYLKKWLEKALDVFA